jgi:hypothetical protein
MSSARSLLVAGLAALACLCCCASAQAAPNNMVALGVGGNGNTLFSFSGDKPSAVTSTPVVGVGVSTLVGIDYRPATGELIGLGVNGDVVSLFAIQPGTGVAAQIGAPATVSSITGATSFGIAFNPAVDRLRVVDNLPSEVGLNVNNFRLNPTNGSLAGLDTDLIFAGLPGGATEAPEVAVAYDRDFVGTTATTLYGIVSGGDRLVTQGGPNGSPSPNTGQLFNVGTLGVDTSNNAGLDIDPATGEAYAALEVGGSSGLYRIDLTTGAAASIGPIGDGSVDFGALTIGPQLPTPPTPSTPDPKLEKLSLKPAAFRAAGAAKAKATGSAKKPAVGTTVAFTISAAATVAFTVERKTLGRKVGKKCLKKTAGNAGRKPCVIWKALKAGFSHSGVAGPNSLRFNGKLGGKALAPGGYKLAAGLGATTLRQPFRIVP